MPWQAVCLCFRTPLQFMDVHGCSWMFMDVHGCSWSKILTPNIRLIIYKYKVCVMCVCVMSAHQQFAHNLTVSQHHSKAKQQQLLFLLAICSQLWGGLSLTQLGKSDRPLNWPPAHCSLTCPAKAPNSNMTQPALQQRQTHD